MITEKDPIIEVIGRTGKPIKKHLFDININPKVEFNTTDGKFYPYISRWYRLPGEFSDPSDAMNVILEFQKKYLV